MSGGEYVGGLVGVNGGSSTIEDAYATGNVIGTNEFVGGLAGSNSPVSTITDAYATGTVSASMVFGALVGTNGGTVSNSYWDITTSDKGTNAGYGSNLGSFNAKGLNTTALTSNLPAGFTSNVWGNGGDQTPRWPPQIPPSVAGSKSSSVAGRDERL